MARASGLRLKPSEFPLNERPRRQARVGPLAADSAEALLHHWRGERAVRREAACAALLGAGIHAAQARKTTR